MKVRDVVQLLEREGFRCTRRRGSHRFFRKRQKRVLVAGHDGDELPKGVLAAIRRQSGLPRDLFR